MNLFLLVTLLLCLLLPSILSADTFVFNNSPDVWRKAGTPDVTQLSYKGTLRCSLPGLWCIKIYYLEYDKASPDEIMYDMWFRCHETPAAAHTANFTIKDGDGISSFQSYDMKLELFHNCSTTGKVHLASQMLPKIHFQQESGGGNYTWDLLEEGTKFFDRPAVFRYTPTLTKSFKQWAYNVPMKLVSQNGRKYLVPVSYYEESLETTTTSPPIVERKEIGQNETEEGSGVQLEGHVYQSEAEYMEKTEEAVPLSKT